MQTGKLGLDSPHFLNYLEYRLPVFLQRDNVGLIFCGMLEAVAQGTTQPSDEQHQRQAGS